MKTMNNILNFKNRRVLYYLERVKLLWLLKSGWAFHSKEMQLLPLWERARRCLISLGQNSFMQEGRSQRMRRRARACTECMLQWSCCSLVHLSSTSTTITQNDMAKLRGIKKAMTTGLWLYRRRSCDEYYMWIRCAVEAWRRRSLSRWAHRGVREVFAQIIDPTLHHCWLESLLLCQIGLHTSIHRIPVTILMTFVTFYSNYLGI